MSRMTGFTYLFTYLHIPCQLFIHPTAITAIHPVARWNLYEIRWNL